MRNGYKVGIVLLISSVVLTFPLLFEYDRVLGDGDIWLFVWNFWWFKFALNHGHSLFFTEYLHHPHGEVAYLHTWVFWACALAAPLQEFLSRIAIINLLSFLTFPLAGLGAYRLCRVLGAEFPGALAGAFAFAFAPYHFAHSIGHFNLINYQWLPFYFAALFLGLREGMSWKRFFEAVLWLSLVALTDWYYFAFALAGTAFALASTVLWRPGKLLRKILFLGGPVVAVLFLVSPILAGMIRTSRGIRQESVSHLFSADLQSFFIPGFVSFWGFLTRSWSGAWVAGVSEIGTFIPWSLALVALLGWFSLESRKARMTAAGWVVVFFFLSLGPHPHWGGEIYESVKLPYGWLESLPFVSIMRAPIRFHLLTFLGLCVLYGLGVNRLARRSSLWLSVAGILLVVELLPAPVRFADPEVSDFYIEIAASPDEAAVLDLHYASRALFYQTVHEKKMLGFPDTVSRRRRVEGDILRQYPFREILAENRILAFGNDPPWQIPPLDEGGGEGDKSVLLLVEIDAPCRLEIRTAAPHFVRLDGKWRDSGQTESTLALDASHVGSLLGIQMAPEERQESFQLRIDGMELGSLQEHTERVETCLRPVLPLLEEYPVHSVSWLVHANQQVEGERARVAKDRLVEEGFRWIVVPFYGNVHFLERVLGLKPSFTGPRVTAYDLSNPEK